MPALSSLGFDNPCQMVPHCEYLLHFELWQRWLPPLSVLLLFSSYLTSDILYQVAPAWKFPLPCSSALIPHTRSPFNMDTLPKLLWLWHPTPGSCSLWISSSLSLGSDFQHWAIPLCGHPWYSSWVLVPYLRLPLTVWTSSSLLLELCLPILGALLCGQHF